VRKCIRSLGRERRKVCVERRRTRKGGEEGRGGEEGWGRREAQISLLPEDS
jgi:hypothetical protein